METLTLVCCTAIIVGASLLLIVQQKRHGNEMKELASDFSDRIQEYQRKLTVLCTEPESDAASEICLHIRLNKAAEEMAENNSEGSESITLN